MLTEFGFVELSALSDRWESYPLSYSHPRYFTVRNHYTPHNSIVREMQGNMGRVVWAEGVSRFVFAPFVLQTLWLLINLGSFISAR